MKFLMTSLLVLTSQLAPAASKVPVTLENLNQLKAPFQLPELPYAYDSLKESIDEETMKIHHSRHHQAYVDNLNKAQVDPKSNMINLFHSISKQTPAVRNNGGGHWNHSFFWSLLTPDSKQREVPDGLKKEIEANFGSWTAFQEAFEKAGLQQFGSGWVWLIRGSDGKLSITSTANQDNPLMDSEKTRGVPLLSNDIWEHAYYLKYQNKRADYLKTFWKVVNWKQVEQYRVESLKLAKSLG
jgi:Fe-Mn family superoxide dismutase